MNKRDKKWTTKEVISCSPISAPITDNESSNDFLGVLRPKAGNLHCLLFELSIRFKPNSLKKTSKNKKALSFNGNEDEGV